MQGTITFYNNQRGFGFITVPDGRQYFFHVSHFTKGESPVLEGLVEFEIAPPVAVGKKPQAVRVRYRTPPDDAILNGFAGKVDGQGGAQ